ncbi:Heavy metal transport/detoxification superfamily protein [Thalictrum thalictroides]|uniref:Heavy metal transport/detoxification superfamily protein n=1 Tax=Thalictrum thalictroides TaxID=46969 RepID=A0A7J6X3H5_THATH|nr:Heavy metal transport/detoxification superfamily protein [Thalictrum thalictroides]
MATIAAIPSLYSSSICRLSSSYKSPISSSSSSLLSFPRFAINRWHRLTNKNKISRIIRAVAEETLIPEEEEVKEEAALVTEQPVSVPVSPSDILTMFFQAEGAMDESRVSKVSKALEEVEGISDLRVQVLEGIASVELKKQTTVQATGVASNLVEIIQGSGFKLQTLNLSFEDEEDASS